MDVLRTPDECSSQSVPALPIGALVDGGTTRSLTDAFAHQGART